MKLRITEMIYLPLYINRHLLNAQECKCQGALGPWYFTEGPWSPKQNSQALPSSHTHPHPDLMRRKGLKEAHGINRHSKTPPLERSRNGIGIQGISEVKGFEQNRFLKTCLA